LKDIKDYKDVFKIPYLYEKTEKLLTKINNEMKNFIAEIKVVLREGILDAQGKAIENSLRSLDFQSLHNVRVGKIITLNIEDKCLETAYQTVELAAKKLLANTIVEDYTIFINEIK